MRSISEKGFTIVELVVVIVVIGILVAITIVSYDGIQGRSYDTAVQSDLRTMGDAAALTTTSGMGGFPAATQAGLSKVVKISKPEAYFSGGGGALLYCRNDSEYSFVGRSVTGNTYVQSSINGSSEVAYNSSANTLCASAGISSATPGYGALWLYNGTTWLSWISI